MQQLEVCVVDKCLMGRIQPQGKISKPTHLYEVTSQCKQTDFLEVVQRKNHVSNFYSSNSNHTHSPTGPFSVFLLSAPSPSPSSSLPALVISVGSRDPSLINH